MVYLCTSTVVVCCRLIVVLSIEGSVIITQADMCFAVSHVLASYTTSFTTTRINLVHVSFSCQLFDKSVVSIHRFIALHMASKIRRSCANGFLRKAFCLWTHLSSFCPPHISFSFHFLCANVASHMYVFPLSASPLSALSVTPGVFSNRYETVLGPMA